MATSPFSNPFAKGTESVPAANKDNTPIAGKGKTADEIEDLLSSEEDEPEVKILPEKESKEEDEEEIEPPIKTKEDKEEEEDDDIELEEGEKNDEEEEKVNLKEEDDDETKLTAPPKVSEIKAKYPKFFEEFPFIQKMMFRDRAYTEMFGSFDEAKEVFNKVDRLNEFESELFDGNIRGTLGALKEANPKAFDKIVDNYLTQLGEVDKEAYDDVIQNFGKRIIGGMLEEAQRKSNKELDEAAKHLYEYLFDADPAKADKNSLNLKLRSKIEKNEEKEQIEKERSEFLKERFEIARDGLTTKVDNILKATISEHIDPRGNMTNYEKKNAVDETLSRLHAKIAKDVNFKKNLDRLWKSAFGDKFSENSLGGIKKSYLGKAKGLISDVIKEVRGEVLKDNRSKGKEVKEEQEERTPSRGKTVNAGRPHQQTVKANERKPGESVEEFLARD